MTTRVFLTEELVDDFVYCLKVWASRPSSTDIRDFKNAFSLGDMQFYWRVRLAKECGIDFDYRDIKQKLKINALRLCQQDAESKSQLDMFAKHKFEAI